MADHQVVYFRQKTAFLEDAVCDLDIWTIIIIIIHLFTINKQKEFNTE